MYGVTQTGDVTTVLLTLSSPTVPPQPAGTMTNNNSKLLSSPILVEDEAWGSNSFFGYVATACSAALEMAGLSFVVENLQGMALYAFSKPQEHISIRPTHLAKAEPEQF